METTDGAGYSARVPPFMAHLIPNITSAYAGQSATLNTAVQYGCAVGSQAQQPGPTVPRARPTAPATNASRPRCTSYILISFL
eukprot:6820144-Prymnesium_polylepis.3